MTPRNTQAASSVSFSMEVVTEHATATLVRTDAFEPFFEATYERLLKAMYLVTGNRHEAEDLAQEAFVRAFERWERVRRTGNPAGYVYRTALNAYRSRLRRLSVAARKVFHRVERDEVAASDERDEIRRALATLSDGQREALVMVEWLGMTDAEAAEILGVQPVTVRVRMSRARETLRANLRGESDE